MPKLKLDAALRKEYDAVADILYTKGLVVDANQPEQICSM